MVTVSSAPKSVRYSKRSDSLSKEGNFSGLEGKSGVINLHASGGQVRNEIIVGAYFQTRT